MSAGVGAPRLTSAPHRLGAAALGVAAVLIASMALTTATWGPVNVSRVLAGGTVAAPAPLPAAAVSVLAGTVALLPGAAPAPINPRAPLNVAVRHGTLRSVVLTDAKSGQQVPGTLAPDAMSWHNTAPLVYGGTYRVAVSAFGADQQVVEQNSTLSTIKPAVLTSASFRPTPTMTSVGVGQPLVVRFNHPVKDKAAAERALTVTSTPAQPGSWFWMSTSEAHYRPQAYWQPGSTIQLDANLFGVDLGGGTFGQADRGVTVHVHDSWVAKADGRSKVMQIFHNGGMVKSMPISLGSPAHPSHNGPHVVSDKVPTMVMDSCTYGVCEGDPGYYKEKVDLDVRISNDGEFVHSAPWSVGQQGSSNVSHGCVNLSPANARWFFDHFNIGDVVEITNSGGPKLPIWDTYGDWGASWDEWQAGGAT